MARILRLLALVLALATTAFWAAKGAHTGWSQDRVPVRQVDEITGLEVLGAGLGLAGLLLTVAVFLPRKSSQPS